MTFDALPGKWIKTDLQTVIKDRMRSGRQADKPAAGRGQAKGDGGVKSAEQGGIQVLLPVDGSNDHRLALLSEAIQLPQQHPQQPSGGFMHVTAPESAGTLWHTRLTHAAAAAAAL